MTAIAQLCVFELPIKSHTQPQKVGVKVEQCHRPTVLDRQGKGGYILVTLPRNVSKVGYAVTLRVFFRCAVGIWPSRQRDDTVTAGAGVDAQRDVARPHLLRP